MQRVQLLIKKTEAFSLVEVLLAVSIFTLFVLGIAGSISFGLQANEVTSYRNRAIYLMDEGFEAVRAIRNEGYSNLVDGTFGLSLTSNKWSLSGSSSSVGEFNRQIQISTVDSTTKKIISTVTWPQQFGTSNTVSSVMYLTNWLRSVPIGSWTTAILSATLNLTGNEDGYEIAYSGNHAYIIRYGGSPNFFSINVTNPLAPTIASSLTLSGNPTDIFISGTYAYVSSEDNAGELKVINITNPASVSLVGVFNASGNQNGNSLSVIGNYVYLIRDNANPNFHIIDVANKAAPIQIGSLSLSGALNNIYISGNYAYISSSNSSSEGYVVNISLPITPLLATSINVNGNLVCSPITGHTNLLFTGCNDGNIYSYNITNPLAPVYLGSFSTASTLVNDLSISQSKNLLFAGTNSATSEFVAIDITNPASLSSTGNYNAPSTINGLVHNSSENLIYAVSSDDASEFIILSTN